jgi:hypothetical protein
MATGKTLHATGDTSPQNTSESMKITLPSQTTALGPLVADGSVVWQFDTEKGLPVVTSADYFGEMYETYDHPNLTKVRDGTTTIPKIYTAYAHGGGHPEVNFTRDDVLGFFAPESSIADAESSTAEEFPRLYVGSLNDYMRLARGATQVIWGRSYERPALAPGQQKHVREICIVRPGEEPFRITRPATEEWNPLEALLNYFSGTDDD